MKYVPLTPLINVLFHIIYFLLNTVMNRWIASVWAILLKEGEAYRCRGGGGSTKGAATAQGSKNQTNFGFLSNLIIPSPPHRHLSLSDVWQKLMTYWGPGPWTPFFTADPVINKVNMTDFDCLYIFFILLCRVGGGGGGWRGLGSFIAWTNNGHLLVLELY